MLKVNNKDEVIHDVVLMFLLLTLVILHTFY